jgi:hypothetical protein
MLFVKKKNEAPNASSNKPTGLFIDPDARMVNKTEPVLEDMPESADDVAPTTSAPAAPEPAATAKSAGFSGLRVSKAAFAKPEKDAESAKPAKIPKAAGAGLLSSLKAKLAPKPKADKADVEASAEAAAAPVPKTAKVKKATATKAPKTAKFNGKAEKRVSLLVELDTGRQLYWTLEADSLVQTTEIPTGPVISFSKEDFRFKADRPLSYKQASDLSLQEIGEVVQVINRSKDLSAVYATRQERAMNATYAILPGQQALDRILTEKKLTGQPLICGFLLKGADDTSLAVLFSVGADGETTKPQISVNPDSMEFVLSQFSASRKLDRNVVKEILFDNKDFLAAIGGATAYPNEPVWRGVPVRQILSGVAVVGLAVSVGLGAWAGYQFQQLTSLQSKKTQLTREMTSTKGQVSNLIMGSVPDFVNAMSLDVPALSARAQNLWIPDTHLTMTADQSSVKYEISMPVKRSVTFGNRPTALDPITPEHHQKLVNFTAPEGCTRTPIGVTGGLNETQLIINCETGNPALAHYRND